MIYCEARIISCEKNWDLLQKSGSNMAASEILIRDRGISVRVMSDVEADNTELCDVG